jgi:hypothetical protein
LSPKNKAVALEDQLSELAIWREDQPENRASLAIREDFGRFRPHFSRQIRPESRQVPNRISHKKFPNVAE